MKNSKIIYLIKNVGLLTLGNFTTKLLSFFLVPLYTGILTTEEVGIYDFLHTTVILLIPILTIDVHEAVTRFALSRENNKGDVLKVGLDLFGVSFFLVLFLTILNHCFGLIKTIDDYSLYFLRLFHLFVSTPFGRVLITKE